MVFFLLRLLLLLLLLFFLPPFFFFLLLFPFFLFFFFLVLLLFRTPPTFLTTATVSSSSVPSSSSRFLSLFPWVSLPPTALAGTTDLSPLVLMFNRGVFKTNIDIVLFGKIFLLYFLPLLVTSAKGPCCMARCKSPLQNERKSLEL